MIRLVASIFFAAVAAIASTNAASAMTIEKIVSPAGIEAWLVREKSLPLVTLNYAFHGGATQDDGGEIKVTILRDRQRAINLRLGIRARRHRRGRGRSARQSQRSNGAGGNQ